MAIEQSGPHRVSQPSVCFAGRLGVWGFPHPARDQWRTPSGATLRIDQDLVYCCALKTIIWNMFGLRTASTNTK